MSTRRGFLGKLLGTAVAAPVVAQELTKPVPVPVYPSDQIRYELERIRCENAWTRANECSAVGFCDSHFERPLESRWDSAYAVSAGVQPVGTFKIGLITRKP